MATNLGQMLAVAQAYASPEQQRKIAQSEAGKAEQTVESEKETQMAELQKLMEDEMKKASDEKGIFGGWAGGLGQLLSFIPAVGTGWGAGLQALEGMGQAKAQKDALRKLSRNPKFAKYAGTWLSDPMKEYKKDISSLMGEIDPLKTGLSSLATGLITGQIGKGITKGAKQMFKGSGTQLGESTIKGVEAGEGMGDVSVTDIVGKMKYDTKGPVKNLIANIKGGKLKDADLMNIIGQVGGGVAGLEALPALFELFEGDKGQGVEVGKLK